MGDKLFSHVVVAITKRASKQAPTTPFFKPATPSTSQTKPKLTPTTKFNQQPTKTNQPRRHVCRLGDVRAGRGGRRAGRDGPHDHLPLRHPPRGHRCVLFFSCFALLCMHFIHVCVCETGWVISVDVGMAYLAVRLFGDWLGVASCETGLFWLMYLFGSAPPTAANPFIHPSIHPSTHQLNPPPIFPSPPLPFHVALAQTNKQNDVNNRGHAVRAAAHGDAHGGPVGRQPLQRGCVRWGRWS